MTWKKHDLIFRLQTPLHIGWRKTSNLMQTRGYVPGKNMWAALTERVTRKRSQKYDPQAYVEIGKEIKESFRFSYFYPTTLEDNCYKEHYPWQKDFDYLFLDSYASTAINPDTVTAKEALLHDTEYIAPYTRTNEVVYLKGNVFVNEDGFPESLLQWKEALDQLQIGGEQGYGWGRLTYIDLLDCNCVDRPQVDLVTDTDINQQGVNTGDSPKNQSLKRLPIHANTTDPGIKITGPIEPLVGWEQTESNGRQLSEATICYAPGSMVPSDQQIFINDNNLGNLL